MKKVTVVIRSSFIDKIPSLKNLILFLGEKGFDVKVITSRSLKYPVFSVDNNNVKVLTVSERTQRISMPTSLKISGLLIRDLMFDKSDLYIGADYLANLLLMKAQRVFNFRAWNFLLEYPDIKNINEITTLEYAEKIITHDRWHSNFLNEKCGIGKEKFMHLPNSTYTTIKKEKTSYLNDLLKIKSDKKLLLHSGGLGEWFLCKELVQSSVNLKKGYGLVFHTSHNASGSSYFKAMDDMVRESNLPVYFSLNPVSNEELDILVGSAYIGLAFYSVQKLGYRAENMGLAAGKIGNYLKCGIPVIASKLHSLEYIENFKCGVLIDSFDNLNSAIDEIEKNYAEYSKNSYLCYEKLWEPKPYLEEIKNNI